MLIVDAATGGIVDANAAATRLFELPDEFHSLTLADCLSASVEQLERILEDAAKTGHLDFCDHHAPPKTDRREIQLQGGAAQYGDQQRLFLIAHECTADEVGSQAASLDALTGLPNQALLRDRLQQALACARRSKEQFAVLFLDLDHFKTINEAHEHFAGDQLLKAFADRLRGFVRATDTVARFGDDKFVVLVTALQDAAHSAIPSQKILRFLATPFDIQGAEMRVTASIGISLYHSNLTTPDDYLERSDAALSVAKRKDRNTYRFDTETLDGLFRTEVAIGTDLHHALDDDKLTIEYQPQIDLWTNRVVGLEALARWSHHRRCEVAPAEFIGVAERRNLIVPLGIWVLRQACLQARVARSRLAAGCYGHQFVIASV